MAEVSLGQMKEGSSSKDMEQRGRERRAERGLVGRMAGTERSRSRRERRAVVCPEEVAWNYIYVRTSNGVVRVLLSKYVLLSV